MRFVLRHLYKKLGIIAGASRSLHVFFSWKYPSNILLKMSKYILLYLLVIYFSHNLGNTSDVGKNTVSTFLSICSQMNFTPMNQFWKLLIVIFFLAVQLQLITSYNYPLEVHNVTTKDGYILQMHRIPYGNNSVNQNSIKGPVLIMHGLEGDSSNWVNHGYRSLGFILADAGYDVWLGNTRGNIWSRRHVSLDTSSTSFEYWDFS